MIKLRQLIIFEEVPKVYLMTIMTRDTAIRKLQRMAYEIVERNFGEKKILLAGIQHNGVIIANILSEFLKPIFAGEVEIIRIDIDKKNPMTVEIVSDGKQVSFNDEVVIITDDVSNSGRTLSYALRPFLSAYPSKIQTLVLVERSHKKFPVSPDYTGLSIATALSEKIVVETKDGDVLGARMENDAGA